MHTRMTLTAVALLVVSTLLGKPAAPTPASLPEGDPDGVALAKTVATLVAQDEKRLVAIFKHLHANPELGFQEVETAALVAKEFKALGYETHTGIGKTGVVAVFKNGPGPVVMFRGDMDALPVRERTDLPYASK